MALLAISAFGVQLRIGNGVPLAPLTIIGASNTSPILVETGSPHGVTDVSHATVTGVGGTTAANGAWIVARVNDTQLQLRGSIGNGIYSAGGTITIDSTYATVAEVTDIQDVGATATVVDCTSHDSPSAWSTKIPTSLQVGNMRLSINFVPTHATHDALTGLYSLFQGRIRRPIMIVLPNVERTSWFMTAITTSWAETHPINGVLTAEVGLESAGDLVLA